jgi:predicted NBD/HSP70 family sugar kinase
MVVCTGIDAGGSRTKIWNAVYDQQITINTSLSNISLDNLCAQIKQQLIENAIFEATDVLGIAIPCGMAVKNGRRVMARSGSKFSSLLGGAAFRDVDQVEVEFFERLQKITFIINDMEALAYDYECQELAIDRKNTLIVSLGTSVGVGFVINGRARVDGLTSEVSHIALAPNGLRCDVCGKDGCWKSHVGGDSRRLKLLSKLSGSSETGFDFLNDMELFNMLSASQKEAYVDDLGRAIVLGLTSIIDANSIERIYLTGGGISYSRGIAPAVLRFLSEGFGKLDARDNLAVVEGDEIAGCRGVSRWAAKQVREQVW